MKNLYNLLKENAFEDNYKYPNAKYEGSERVLSDVKGWGVALWAVEFLMSKIFYQYSINNNFFHNFLFSQQKEIYICDHNMLKGEQFINDICQYVD